MGACHPSCPAHGDGTGALRGDAMERRTRRGVGDGRPTGDEWLRRCPCAPCPVRGFPAASVGEAKVRNLLAAEAGGAQTALVVPHVMGGFTQSPVLAWSSRRHETRSWPVTPTTACACRCLQPCSGSH